MHIPRIYLRMPAVRVTTSKCLRNLFTRPQFSQASVYVLRVDKPLRPGKPEACDRFLLLEPGIRIGPPWRLLALRLIPGCLTLEKVCKFFARYRPALDQVWNLAGLLQSYEAIPGCYLKMESLGASLNSNEEVILAVSHGSKSALTEARAVPTSYLRGSYA